MIKPYRILAAFSLLSFGIVCACSDDEGKSPDDGPAPTLPDIEGHVGVVYVGNYVSSDILWYRIDGDAPRSGGSITLADGKATHDLAVDRINDLLYVVSDDGQTLDIYRLSRPTSPADDIDAPQLLSTVDFTNWPVFVHFDPYDHRVYVIVIDTVNEETELAAFDVSDPANPAELAESPFSIRATASSAYDSVRKVLFVVDFSTDELLAYDLSGDAFAEVPGGPVDLQELYPEENMFTFQARSLEVDPFHARLYAGRAQGELSELIALTYPEALPTATRSYAELASLGDIQKLDDAFDVSLPTEERRTIIEAFEPVVDVESGAVFMAGAAVAGINTPALMMSFSPELELGSGCEDVDGFGCWYQLYSDGEAFAYQVTDGATCIDFTHGVIVGTTYDDLSEEGKGATLFFQYQDDLSMSPWLPADGGNLYAGVLPVAAGCH